MTQNIRYFNLQKEKKLQAEIEAETNRLQTRHIDFLLQRKRDAAIRKLPRREHVLASDVAIITEKTLKHKALDYHGQLQAWRPDLAFRNHEQVKLIDSMPHLGYAAITSGTFPEKDGKMTPWILYFANFNAQFGKGNVLFDHIPMAYGITFFALALDVDGTGDVKGRDLSKRGNGLLFSTQDPVEAFENIVKLRDIQKTWVATARIREAERQEAEEVGAPAPNSPPVKARKNMINSSLNIPEPVCLKTHLFTA